MMPDRRVSMTTTQVAILDAVEAQAQAAMERHRLVVSTILAGAGIEFAVLAGRDGADLLLTPE